MEAASRLSLSADSASDLLKQLQAVDITVPIRSEGGKNEKQYKERYMMARFLATMADTGRLAFPLKLVHGEKPDFRLSFDGAQVGVECVEAVPAEHRHIEDIRERYYPEALNFGQKFAPGQETLTLDEKHAIASGTHAGPPWMSGSMLRNWLDAMTHVISGKTTKFRKGNYAATASAWLLVQDEWPNPLRLYPDQIRSGASELVVRLDPLLAPPAFQSVFIASGEQLACIQRGHLVVETICNLWR